MSSTSLQNKDGAFFSIQSTDNYVSSVQSSPVHFYLYSTFKKHQGYQSAALFPLNTSPKKCPSSPPTLPRSGIDHLVIIPEINDVCPRLMRQIFSQTSTCPGRSTAAFHQPELHRSLTAGRHTRPSTTDVCCCSGSLEKRRRGQKRMKTLKKYTNFTHVNDSTCEKSLIIKN